MSHGTVSVAQNKLGARANENKAKKGGKARKELNLDLARVPLKAHALPLCYGPVGGGGLLGRQPLSRYVNSVCVLRLSRDARSGRRH